jgi:hypothetical protein
MHLGGAFFGPPQLAASFIFRCQRNGPSSGGKLRPSWGLMPGTARHDSDVGSRSAAAINFCVKVACFEITSGYFGQYPGRRGG